MDVSGVIPFADLPEIGDLSNFESIELPNPYTIVAQEPEGRRSPRSPGTSPATTATPPIDHAWRPSRPPAGNRSASESADFARRLGITQEELSSSAGIGRVTLIRIEKGEQSPRYETLVALSRSLGLPLAELLLADSGA